MEFVGYKYIAQFLVLSEIFGLLILYRRNPAYAIYLTLLSMTLKGQYLWIGRPIYAWQFAAVLTLFFLANKRKFGTRARPGSILSAFNGSMQLYFIYSLAVSVPFWMLLSAEGLGTINTAVSSTRIATQLVYFLFAIGLYHFGVRSGEHMSTFGILRALVIIATVVAYFALLQVAVLKFMGLNIFPIIGSDDTVHSAYILGSTFRANSFAGEPKHLGMLMAVGLTAFYLARLFRFRIGGRFAFHMPLAMLFALLLSLSTTGIVLAITGAGISSVLFFYRMRAVDMVISGMLAAIVLIWIANANSDFLVAMDRQLAKNDLEIQDESVRLGLFANPVFLLTGTGLGNIHLLAVDYLPPEFPLFKDEGYKANSGLFFVIGDSGLIGLLVVLAAPLFGFWSYARERKFLSAEQRKEAALSLGLVAFALISFLLRYDILYFFVCGFVFSRLSLLRQKPHVRSATLNQTRLNRAYARV